MDQEIEKLVVQQYLSSGFNGLSVRALKEELQGSKSNIDPFIIKALKNQRLSAEFGDRHPNPHIMAFPPEDSSAAIAKFREGKTCCLYPSPKVLKAVVNPSDYEGRPYSLMLALGRPQLDYISFRPEVLDIYRADPRFHYEVSDVGGRIHLKDEYQDSAPVNGNIYVQSYGFSFDSDMNRAVAVCLWDLHCLTPAQQQLWRAFQHDGEFDLHPGYYQTQVLGQWPDKISICQAFLEELSHINAMCSRIDRSALFRTVPKERPKNFGFLLRTTSREFDSFVHLLDKLMSDNLNKDFFGGDIALFRNEVRTDGSVIEVQKGTIQLLEEWLGANFRADDPKPIEQMLGAFRSVRKLRQKPAHAIDEDRFDPALYKRQRQLLVDAYTAVRTLRLILANHPKVKGYVIPRHLYEGNIWEF